MAKIQITDEWRISSDEHQWTVERRRGDAKDRKTGVLVPNWRPVTHHQSLEAAARSLAMRHVRTADVEGVAAVMAEWHSITADIDQAFASWKVAA